jgi:hypothetical protein
MSRLSRIGRYPVPHYTRWGLYPQGIFVIGCWFCMHWWPLVPGVAIGFLALAAAVMAVRADNFTQTEKAVWVVISLVLCFVELRTIYQDRDAHDREQSELRIQESEARAKETQSFAALIKQGQDFITQTRTSQDQEHQHFAALLREDKTLFVRQEQLAEGLNGRLLPHLIRCQPLRNFATHSAQTMYSSYWEKMRLLQTCFLMWSLR